MPPLLPALGEFDRGCAAATCSIAGGRFEDWPQGWKDDKMGRPYGALLPENGILVNPRDAERLGLEDGRQVRVVSATNPAGEWDLGGDRRKAMVARSSSLLEEHQEQPADAVRIAVRNGKRRRRDGRPSG